MAFDEPLARRVREALKGHRDVREKRMFGGLAFLLRGHMCCGIVGEELMVRVGPDTYEAALTQAHARPMDFTGRPMKGFVFVASAGIATDLDLESWVMRGVDLALSLPAK